MPFTLAHPAAAVPLARLLRPYAVLSALVVGSMTPDLIMFVPLGITRQQSHSLGAVLWFCLPVGLVLLVLFHALVKRPVLLLLPDAAGRRLAPYGRRHGVIGHCNLASVAVCLMLGALTHIAWDSFTHRSGWVVQALPWLDTIVCHLPGYSVRVYKILQHGSTALGTVLLAYWIVRWWCRESSADGVAPSPLHWRYRVCLIVLLLAVPCLVGLAAGSQVSCHRRWIRTVQSFTRATVLSGGATVVWLLLAYGTLATLVEWVFFSGGKAPRREDAEES